MEAHKYMWVSNEVELAKEWEKYQNFTVRPLPSTLQYYQKTIGASYCQNALLYGATPEIRSIFQDLTIPLTMVDQSELMVRAMGLLTHNKIPISRNEKHLEGDWLSLPNLSQRFDLIIGDDAINMVTWPNFPRFLQHSHRLLKQNGIFVCHLLVKPDEELINQSFVEVMQKFKSNKIKTIYDLASYLNFICYNPNSYAMGWQQTISTLGKTNLNQFIPALDFVNIFGRCNSQFYCPPQAQFEDLVSQNFFIEEIFYPYEYDYCLFEPVYILRKK